MYAMNPDLSFGLERMRERLRRAELARLARPRQPEESSAPAAPTPELAVAIESCEPCGETLAA
jgi:hypothetical protein